MSNRTFGGTARLLCMALPAAMPLCGAYASEAVGSNELSAAREINIPLPPLIDGLIGLPQTFSRGRSAYLTLLTQKAEAAGLPAAMADAVIKVESSFNPHAVGSVGEVGLMQLRPETAAMLGYKGGVTGLFEPEVNVHYGVAYLARAWQLAKGDVCRALMKYRAGWGEERMSPLSVEYCRRARGHLASIGSPLAEGAVPTDQPAGVFSVEVKRIVQRAPGSLAEENSHPTTGSSAMATRPRATAVRAAHDLTSGVRRVLARVQPTPASVAAATKVAERVHVLPRRPEAVAIAVPPPRPDQLKVAAVAAPPPRPHRLRVAAVGPVKLSEAQVKGLEQQVKAERARKEARRQMRSEHSARMDAIANKLKTAQLKIIAGAR